MRAWQCQSPPSRPVTHMTQGHDTASEMPDDYAMESILPDPSKPMDEETWKRVKTNAQGASDFLKALSHEGRLMILCSLAHGEKSVTELEQMLSSRQAAVSQQLARLRQEKLISARREGKQIFYSLTDERARRIIEQVYELFCS
jgi:DNA-binding transcriptional ArsR family regulator